MGIEALKLLVNEVDKNKSGIIIMPGCGINKENLTNIVKTTGAVEFHASASAFVEVPVHYNNKCSMGTQDEKAFMVSQETVAYMAAVIKCHKMDGKLGLPEFQLFVNRRLLEDTKMQKKMVLPAPVYSP